MTTRIDPAGPLPRVSTGPTAARTTATPARPFQQLLRASAEVIVSSAEQMATRLPGAPILAAALRPGAGGALMPGVSPEGAASAAANGLPGTAAGAAGAAGSGGGIESALSQNADQNMYFLALQERISQESRSYTALSNVLKTRHETVKNAIGNIR